MKNVISQLTKECLDLFSKSISYGLTKEERARMNELEKAIKVLEKAQKEEEASKPKEPKVLSTKEVPLYTYGVSVFGGDRVHVLGERTVELEDGRVVEQYLYDIVGYTPANGLPFAALKANIIID